MLAIGTVSYVPAQGPPPRPGQPPRQQSKPSRTNKIFKMFNSGSTESAPTEPFIISSKWFPKKSDLLTKDKLLDQDPALDDAYEKARDKVVAYLREKKMASHWTPSVLFIRDHMLADLRENEVKSDDPKGELNEFKIADHYWAIEETHITEQKGEEKTEQRRVWIKLMVNPENWKLILKEVRQAEDDKRLVLMRSRMFFLFKLLVGLVVLFATICTYLRLDEWSKGYYTKWLRLAAVGCIGAVSVFLWFLVSR
jgi:hypothetical protein